MGSKYSITKRIPANDKVSIKINCENRKSSPTLIVVVNQQEYIGVFNSCDFQLGSEYHTTLQNLEIESKLNTVTGKFEAIITGITEYVTIYQGYALLNYYNIRHIHNNAIGYVIDNLPYLELNNCKCDIADEGKR